MRKIALLVPVFAHQDFIIPFVKSVKGVDKLIFLIQKEPIASYVIEHKCPSYMDSTEEIIKQVSIENEWVEYKYSRVGGNNGWDHSSIVYNDGLSYVKDYDIVMKMDVDYFFEPEYWSKLLSLIRATEYDSYSIDFSAKHCINYYVTGSFSYGIMDSDGRQLLAFKPDKGLSHENDYDSVNPCKIEENIEGIILHHLRGWKPKYTEEFVKAHHFYGELNKDFLTAPKGIINYFK